MSRKQNRHRIRNPRTGQTLVSSGKTELIRPEELQGAKDVHGNDAKEMLEWRLSINEQATGHPWHHLTADGTIVDHDPTSEFLLTRVPPDDRDTVIAHWESRINPNAPKAVPVNRLFYGFDPYAK